MQKPAKFAVKQAKYEEGYCQEADLVYRLNSTDPAQVFAVKVYDWVDVEPRSGLGPEKEDQQYYFRLFYEYYPGGTLKELMDDYTKHKYKTPPPRNALIELTR